MQRPRFRNDLVSKPIEENGQRFVDVTDPDSGKTFRFYEVEYAVACAMNGSRNVNDLIDWTRAELGLEPSQQEVETVISTLGDLGYLDGGNSAAEPAGLDLALGSPGRSPMDAGSGPRAPAQDFELGVAGKSPMGGPPKRPAPQAADLELGAAGFGGAEAPTPALEPEVALGAGPGPVPNPAPAPGPPPTDENMSTDLSQHLQIGTDDVKEAVRQSKVMEAVPIPADLMPEDPAAAQRPQQLREPPPGATPIELPSRPPSAQPPPAKHIDPPPPRPRSGSNLTIILLIAVLVVAVGGAAYYFLVYAKDDTEGVKRPRGAGAKKIERDKAPKPPAKVVAMLKAGSTVDAVIKAPKDGKLEWIEAAGTEVSAGAIVAKYRGFDRVKTKITKALASKARYQEKLERAKERDNQKAMARASADIERKDQDIANLQAEAMSFAVKAAANGVVTPLVQAKGTAKAGQELIKLATTSGPSAVFEVPDPAKHEVGDKVEIAAESDPSLTAICDIDKIEGKRVSIACPTDSGIEEGAAVALKPVAEK